MASAIYLLCALTALTCSMLLLRGYRHGRRSRFLFWSGLCFGLLAVNNVLLFMDRIIFPAVDLSLGRASITILALALLLYGMIFEVR
jgi:hypothetical protein